MESKLYHYRAKIVRVVDGDTLDAEIDMGFSTWNKTRLRLDRINAYEVKLYKGVTEEDKAKGLEAKAMVEEMLAKTNGECIVHTTEQGKYGRWVAEVWIDSKNLADELLLKNLAVKAEY